MIKGLKAVIVRIKRLRIWRITAKRLTRIPNVIQKDLVKRLISKIKGIKGRGKNVQMYKRYQSKGDNSDSNSDNRLRIKIRKKGKKVRGQKV